MHHRYVGLDVS